MSGRRIQTRIQRLTSHLLNPALCLGCTHELDYGQYFCSSCTNHLAIHDNPCTLCGLENQTSGSTCAVCLYDPPRWQKMIVPLRYQGLARDLLIQLKFAESLHLANSLVSSVIQHFRASNSLPEVLLPVPLHRKRLLDRGYNQAFEIARVLSHLLNIPVDTSALHRNLNTQSQSGLTAYQRQKNILKAFVYETVKPYSHVAVVDDIVTTGSTANEITKTLHRAGIDRVEIWGLARVLK